jgi:serine phosphatase RsbU (regulator of sigma subunit)
LIDFSDKRVRVAVIVVAAAAITVIGLLVDEPGPVFLIPAVLAGIWLGRVPGLITGIICAALFAVTREINPAAGASGAALVGTITRLVVFGGIGYLVGALVERESLLRGALDERERELVELREVQAALTPPEPPERPALELATCYLPAEHGVSGDFHAVVPADGDATMIAVGDVAGRGIDAAKRSRYVRTLLASSAEVVSDPGAILERANQSLIEESGYGSFITAVCLMFHPDGRLEWALAGHDPPLRLGDGSPLAAGAPTGLPLGVADRLGCATNSSTLAEGEGALLYTDGLTEARRGGNGDRSEFFGEERVSTLVGSLGGAPSTEVVDRVREEVKQFTSGSLSDDLCVVALRRSASPDATEVC